MTLPVTVILAVRNEAANLPKCLLALQDMERVVVVDSGSTDATVEIAEQHGAEVWQFEWGGGYPKKRQWALDHIELKTPWVLLLDADEVVPPQLAEEIKSAVSDPNAKEGYLIRKGFHFLGQRLRFGGFSHEAVLLFKVGTAKFERFAEDGAGGLDMEVHERILVEGDVGRLKTPLIHEDFKGLHAYVARHNQYSDWDAAARLEFITRGTWGAETIAPKLFGNAQERNRFLKQLVCRLPFEHWVWFFYHYVLNLGFLEGKAGLIASRLRAQHMLTVRAKMYQLQQAKESAAAQPHAIPMQQPGAQSSGKRAA